MLNLERVGIHDNFFQLGGDSILSIQIVARARREGLLITPRQLFENQTIAGLAAVAGSPAEEGEAAASQDPVEGEAPLTPIQRRFFAEERREPGRFNQAVLLVPRERLAAAPLAAALDRLAAHHDALRLRFGNQGRGVAAGPRSRWDPCRSWRSISPRRPLRRPTSWTPPWSGSSPGSTSGAGPSSPPPCSDWRTATGCSSPPTTWWWTASPGGCCWRTWRPPCRGLPLPPKTTSWKRWAELLAAHARSPGIAAELPYWLGLPAAPPLPRDLDGGGSAAVATVAVELGAEETRALLQEVPEVYHTQVNDLLLAALARAFAAWTGAGTLLVGLEGHGREEIFPGVDLSRTVGWFTTLFPVALSLPAGGGPREAIRAVKETLRAVPGRGLGYGLLRYGTDARTGDRLAALRSLRQRSPSTTWAGSTARSRGRALRLRAGGPARHRGGGRSPAAPPSPSTRWCWATACG